MKLFKNLKKLSPEHLNEIAVLTSAVAVLLLVAAFVGTNGESKIQNFFATAGLAPQSQTASVFPENNTSFSDVGLFFAAGQSSTVSPGASVSWVWNAGTYGANTFSQACLGNYLGADYVCKLTIGMPSFPTNCIAQSYTTNDDGQITSTIPSSGDCGNVDGSNYYHILGASYPGNFDGFYGVSGGNTPVGYGYPGGHVTLTAPSTPGVYTYYMCSYFIAHKYGSAYACASNNLTVVAPPCANGLNVSSYPSCACPSGQVQSGPSCIAPTPTTLTSLTATPPTIVSGNQSTLAWSGTKGTNFSACELIDDFGHGWWYTALPGQDSSGILTTPGVHGFYMNCFDTTGASTGWRNTGIIVTTAPPTSCSNGLDVNTYPSCSCPSGQQQSGSSCVAIPPPSCSNGLDVNTYPSCSCPSGQQQSGSSCVPKPLCSNGLNNSYAPSCTCPSGQYQPPGSSSCVVLPVCQNGLNISYSPNCLCPSGEIQSGSTCVVPGSITTFTASPIRVQKGQTTTVSWSTSHMSACTLSQFSTAGTITVSSALSGSLTPTINGQTIFTLNCTDTADEAIGASQTVNVIPTVIEQ